MTMQFNAPPGSASTVDGTGSNQMNNFYWEKRAIIDAKKDMFFTQLADVHNMPKHFGKEIKVYQYIPLLDDRNINDQGIDANGVTISKDDYFVSFDKLVYSFAVEADATAATAAVNAIEAGVAVKTGTGPWTVTMSKGRLVAGTLSETNAVLAVIPTASVFQGSGNLYGSSKDIGTINGRLPMLTENGGRVNRVGFTRLQRSGTLKKFGFFFDFTQESFDFDSDSELYGHLSRELVTGATQLTEAVLQKDLLMGAGVVVYAGAATSHGTITAEGVTPSIVDYDDLSGLAQILYDNRTPTQTKVITGSRMIDTKTIDGGYVMYIGSELESTVRRMKDPFDNPAFVPVHQYAAAATILTGEIGSIDKFRIIMVPEMLHWSGEGANVVTNPGYRATDGKYNVYPMLVVGAESFTTIGFQTDGKTVKFKIITKMPGEKTADINDPYGEIGFSSIKWYYGYMIMRPERLAVVKTVARM